MTDAQGASYTVVLEFDSEGGVYSSARFKSIVKVQLIDGALTLSSHQAVEAVFPAGAWKGYYRDASLIGTGRHQPNQA